MIAARKKVFSARGGLTRLPCALESGKRIGFALKGGALVHGAGAQEYKGENGAYHLPEGCVPEALYFLRTSDTICAAAYAGGRMYVCMSDGGVLKETNIAFTSPPASVRAYDGQETLVLSDGESVCLFTAQGLSPCAEIPPFSCAGYAYERLWVYAGGGDVQRVQFSAVMDIRDFEGGGVIDLPDGRGDILSFTELDNVFYIFRQFGIQKLTAKGREEDFVLSDADAPAARICHGSICTENGKAYFLTDRGMYSFDGSSVKPFFRDHDLQPAPGENVRAAACGGRVYLSADFEAGRALGIFCEDEKDGFLVAEEGRALCAVRAPSGLYIVFYKEGRLYTFPSGAPGGAPALWESAPALPFGGAEGVLEELVLAGEGNFALEAVSERGCRRIDCLLSGGAKRFRIDLRGARFVFRVHSRGEAGKVFALTAGYSDKEVL